MYFDVFCSILSCGVLRHAAVHRSLMHLDEGTVSVACAIGSTCASAADSCWFQERRLLEDAASWLPTALLACFCFVPFHPLGLSIILFPISIAILRAYPIFRHAHVFSRLLWPLGLQPRSRTSLVSSTQLWCFYCSESREKSWIGKVGEFCRKIRRIKPDRASASQVGVHGFAAWQCQSLRLRDSTALGVGFSQCTCCKNLQKMFWITDKMQIHSTFLPENFLIIGNVNVRLLKILPTSANHVLKLKGPIYVKLMRDVIGSLSLRSWWHLKDFGQLL